MKNVLLFFTIALIGISCIRVNENPNPQITKTIISGTDGIFIHVKQGADNEHEVLMALNMANKFAEDYNVLMYFDIDGIDMVTADAPNLEMEPFGSSDELFKKLIDQGITIYACPGCMEVANVSPSDLRTGVTTAKKDEFFDFTDGRILTIDY